MIQDAAEYEKIASAELIRYPLPLLGEIQLINSAVALATVEMLQKQSWQISPQAIAHGMAKTIHPGRMQWVTWQKQQLLIDGAHNGESAQVLRDYVDSLSELETATSITWIVGILATKDCTEILRSLLRPGDKLYLVPVPDSNSANLSELAELAQSICPNLSFCHSYPDLFLALAEVFTHSNDLVVLSGSLYLIGYFLQKPSP